MCNARIKVSVLTNWSVSKGVAPSMFLKIEFLLASTAFWFIHNFSSDIHLHFSYCMWFYCHVATHNSIILCLPKIEPLSWLYITTKSDSPKNKYLIYWYLFLIPHPHYITRKERGNMLRIHCTVQMWQYHNWKGNILHSLPL